jgi:hypothetical protein
MKNGEWLKSYITWETSDFKIMRQERRILVTGFPHCGTSILRAKLGEANNVYEQIEESEFPLEEEFLKYLDSNKEFYLWKDPIVRWDLTRNGFADKVNTHYKNDIIVCILRNPYYVFTSQIKRGLNPFETQFHTYHDYIRTAQIFLEAKEKQIKNVYCIQYENLFENDFAELKKIMGKIGLSFDDSIFYQKSKTYTMNIPPKSIRKKPEHGTSEYRVWQMNKKFENFNSKSKIELPSELIEILKSSEEITKLGYNI